MDEDEPRPIKDSLLGEDTHLIRTLDPIQEILVKRHFKSLSGRLLRACVYYLDDQPIRFQPTVFVKGLKRFLRLHKFLLNEKTRQYDRINYCYYLDDPLERLPVFQPAYIGVVKLKGRKASIKKVFESDNPKLPPMLITRDIDGTWAWITSRTPMQQCPRCGRYWVKGHVCNQSRSAFFYHVVEKSGRKLWQHVPFKCPAKPPQSKQLFVVYDIETYTIFEKKGKRMHPFMLCFMISGDEDLVKQANEIAMQDLDIRTLDGGYYWINKAPGIVARRFRQFRTALQQHFSKDLVKRYYQHNKEYFDQVMCDGKYPSIYDIPYEMLSTPAQPLTLPTDFYVVDIIILGHNITRFDELLIATEMVEDRGIFPQAGRCERSFMPRVGRLLFNDIHFHLPNPNYIKDDSTRTERWAEGIFDIVDMKNVSVRFLVRDTLQLTSGAKLKKAAAAYSLELSKGECPYDAINEMISTGTFDKDVDGFPEERYWESKQIMIEQKELWANTHPGEPYDIIRACLEYCMQDVKVTKALANTLYDSYNIYFQQELGMKGQYNIFDRPTIPSNTHALWKQLAFTLHVEQAKDNITSKKRTKKKIPHNYVGELYAPYREMFGYIRQALRGGRCYPTVLGPYREPVYVFDICGMYASALTHPMPYGMPLDPKCVTQHVDELNEILTTKEKISYFDTRIKPSILKIDAYPPPITDLDPLPPVCSRRGGRLVWTNEELYDEVITVLDIITLHNRGWKVIIKQDPMNIVFPVWKTICADYVSKNIAAKEKADKEKNEVMRSISKMLSNALYGAFATNMDTSRVVFEQDMTEKDNQAIYEGTQIIKHVTLLYDNSFTGKEVNPSNAQFKAPELTKVFNSPWSREIEQDQSDDDDDEPGDSKHNKALTNDPLLTDVDQEVEKIIEDPFFKYPTVFDTDSAHYASANDTEFKPMHFMDASPEALTVLHLEALDQMVENKRYATQIACFVLGWSRTFFSEWAEILHEPDRGIHPHNRAPQSLYGDTDSVFVTESGYQRMITRGAHRIKSKDTRLTFDPENPALYWACECDIKCKKCGAPTYSTESIFLAPKLYGLKDAVCTNTECGFVGAGKIRSKGHRQAELIYDTLMKCWCRHEDQLYGGQTEIPELHTSRVIFKTTLLNKVSKYDPFTIHNEPLTRVLRPWKDLTLYQFGDYLYPYNTANPNPRTANQKREVVDVGEEEPLAILPNQHAFLTVEECDDILQLLGDGAEEEVLEL